MLFDALFIATEADKVLNNLIYNLRYPIRTKLPKCSCVTYCLKSLRFLGNKI